MSSEQQLLCLLLNRSTKGYSRLCAAPADRSSRLRVGCSKAKYGDVPIARGPREGLPKLPSVCMSA
eukprot:1890324-Pleurochrysis_carterae.AAC.4